MDRPLIHFVMRRYVVASTTSLMFLLASCAMAASIAEPSAMQGGTRQTLQVGANRIIKTIAQAAVLARDGDTVEVDAGNYLNDVAVWQQDNLTVRAVGGRVRLQANGASAEGKGIWVIRGGRIQVEGFDFSGARVADRNGAGIRFEKGALTVRHCSFVNNEMGLLTGNDERAELSVENSEFAHNKRPDGHNHNLYVGRIARLSVKGSYFHHGHTGHLLKSRARVTHIENNRLTDETDGRASYELEFPDGGVAYVIGNIIGQSRLTENPVLISFGAEGYKWPVNQLYLVNNTLINDRLYGGSFLRVRAGADAVRAVNNLLVGPGKLEHAGTWDFRNNFTIGSEGLENLPNGNFRLKIASSPLGRAVDPGSADGQDLKLYSEYVHPLTVEKLGAPAQNPGAVQRSGQPRP